MKKLMFSLIVAALAGAVVAADQYGTGNSSGYYLQYVNDIGKSSTEPITYRPILSLKYKTGVKTKVNDYAGHGHSYIAVGANVKSLTIKFAEFQDICQSPIGFYTYGADFIGSDGKWDSAAQAEYIAAFRESHPESELGLGKTSITLNNIKEGDKVAFWMESTDTYGTHSSKHVDLVTQYNLRDPSAEYNGTDQYSIGRLLNDVVDEASVGVYFGDYSTTPWKYNDEVTISTIIMTVDVVDPTTGDTHELTIEYAGTDAMVVGDGKIIDDKVVVPEPPTEISGQPLPGALAVFLLVGGIAGGRKMLRKQKKA